VISSSVTIDAATRAHLGLQEGAVVWMLPLD